MADRMVGPPLPSLYQNGADDPDRWSPDYRTSTTTRHVEVGDLIPWRYGAWRVVEVRRRDDADLSPDETEQVGRHVMVLRHESGPLIVKPGEPSDRLHDGGRVVHLSRRGGVWSVLREPYQTCSCHGHIWPCQEIDQAAVAVVAAARMDKAMATAQPGVCAHCLEAISTRQRAVTFPEESRLVPGAPGPTFHAGRGACWQAAEKYEREGRLKDNPDVVRLASCPGVRFLHEARSLPAEQRLDCTAGPLCTGLHGHGGSRSDVPCWHPISYAGNDDAFARPLTDCGYRTGPEGRGCLAQHVGGSTAANEIAGDLLWQQSAKRWGW